MAAQTQRTVIDKAAAFLFAAIALGCGAAVAQSPAEKRLDPLAQSVVDSLAQPPRTTPLEFFDACVRSAEVEAYSISLQYFARLKDLFDKAGDARLEMLADVGDATDAGTLARLDRVLGDLQANVRPLLNEIQQAASLRQRDPVKLAKAIADLRSESVATRVIAADRLARVGVDAIPVLVNLLETTDAPGKQARSIGRGLFKEMGDNARQPLLAWLGSDADSHWNGVIAGLCACEATDVFEYLLAPALVAKAPPVQRRAIAALRLASSVNLDADLAIPLVARRLDRLLSPAGLPLAEATIQPTVERFIWIPPEKRIQRSNLPPRAARALDALHLARDLQALNAIDPSVVNLVLLTQLEALLALRDDPLRALEEIQPAQLRDVLSGPEGFNADSVADILEMAVDRGLLAAAAAAAQALGNASSTAAEKETEAPLLSASVRKALLRALAVPDGTLRFTAARSLAVAAGDGPYKGSSQVVKTLLHAATSIGIDRAIVAHPDIGIAQSMATGLSRFGYQTVRVSSGRDAILKSRDSSDTVLVMVSARVLTPTVLETVGFIRSPGNGENPAVMIVVDPLDHNDHKTFCSRLDTMFSEVPGVAIVDRLDSFFQPTLDDNSGKVIAESRFPDVLAQIAGPSAALPAARKELAAIRLVQARQSLLLLGSLARRGWDISAAVPTATLALRHETLFSPALSLLSILGDARAQQAILREIEREDLLATSRNLAVTGFQGSVKQFGVLLETETLLATFTRYNRITDVDHRQAIGAVIDAIETPRTQSNPLPDAQHSRPIP